MTQEQEQRSRMLTTGLLGILFWTHCSASVRRNFHMIFMFETCPVLIYWDSENCKARLYIQKT